MRFKLLFQYLRYDWPVHFFLLITNWLPDNVIFIRLRGFLIKQFLGSCKGKLQVARNVVLQNPINLHLGERVYIGHGVCFLAASKIEIGDNVNIAPYCVIVSADHVRIDGSFANGKMLGEPINIMDGCWLGAHVVVTAGSIIAAGSGVGAGAVVCDVFKNSALLGGVPAKVIKYFD